MLQHKMKLIRKERAVGLISASSNYVPRDEVLNELVFGTQEELSKASTVPFCAFNSGKDVWVDVGTKTIGVESLQQYINVSPISTLHVGDQMGQTGNDVRTRYACPTLWVASPKETNHLLKLVLRDRVQQQQDQQHLSDFF